MKAQWEVGAKCGIRIPKTTMFEVQSFGRVEPHPHVKLWSSLNGYDFV
jgi:hypothetical protein